MTSRLAIQRCKFCKDEFRTATQLGRHLKVCNAKANQRKSTVKPLNVITLETFMWQAENAMRLDPEDRRKYVTAVTGPNRQVHEHFQCLICFCFAHEPQVCSQCETAITCKHCFDQWKSQMGRQAICPSCRVQQEPRRLFKAL